jgi:DNA-binding CsgD family transcriptional regulator
LTLHPTRLEFAPLAEAQGEALFVLIHDPEFPVQVGYTELRELFGLTLTEARLTNLMMQGKSVDECTGLLGIRRSTVKMHLRNLYGKTGVQRQCELVSLMFKSFGNVRSGQRSLPERERRAQRASLGTAC